MSNPEQQLQNRVSEEEAEDGVPIVLVTGASGFIATHLIKQLLQQGRYHVRGTVRSLKKEEKVWWSPETGCPPYEKSKLKAEQAAWDFVKKLDDSKRFELAVVNPAYVQGPLLSASSGEGSKEFCDRLLPDLSFPIVDVRDVAAAHIAAVEKSEAAGNRHILTNRTAHMTKFAKILRDEFQPQGYTIPSEELPKSIEIPELGPMLGKVVQYNNERMVKVLGIQPRPIEDSLIDTCYSLIDLGLADLEKTSKYLGHPSTRSE